MANIIKPKRTSTVGKVPTTADLASGEIGVNMADKKVYINYSGTIVEIGSGLLSGLGDVALSTLTAGQSLSWNGTAWTNSSAGAGDVVGPSSATDNALARFDTTTGKLIQNSVVTLDDTGNLSGILSQQFANGSAVTLAAGKMWYDGSTGSWNLGMGGGNITQQVGEEFFVYGKASTAITDSPLQIVYQTGVVGASGVIQFAPTTSGITNGDLIIGVATEPIALNGFGRITSSGVIHGITTNGTAYGETWANGDVIWYNPATGNPTNVKPSAPNIKVQIGVIISAGNGGSGSIQVEINHGSVLGGTDANVQFSSLATGDLIRYNGTYWTNVATIPNSNLTYSSITINGTAVSLGGTVSVGTVTSVTATSPVASTGGTTPVISMPAATTSVSGYLTSTDWNTFNGKYSVGGALGTPSSGTLTNCTGYTYANLSGTVPTWNQNTTGSSASCTGNAATATTATTATTANGVAAGVVAGKMIYDTFTANGSTTSFSTSVAYTSGKIEVYCNGVKMRNGSDVTVTSGTAVVFATAPANTSLIDLVYPT